MSNKVQVIKEIGVSGYGMMEYLKTKSSTVVHDKDGFFPLSFNALEKDLGLSRHKQETILQILLDKEYITQEVKIREPEENNYHTHPQLVRHLKLLKEELT